MTPRRGPNLERIAARLESRQLRPVIDRAHGVVRADCPACGAGDQDPLCTGRSSSSPPATRSSSDAFACEADRVH